MDVLIDVRGLAKRFGAITAVDGVSFTVARGEVLGFLGPNGAGKSTTMKMLTGFLTPTAGTAVVAGQDVRRDPVAVERALGYLPEGAPLYGDMTPAALLDFIADIRGLSGAAKAGRIGAVVERIELREVLHRPIETLSKGFKRRVGLAQAILHDPAVLILDEPTDGLDPNQKHQVRELIREMAPTKAIVISTHILEEVDAICSRAVVIARGRIVADDTPAGLRARSPVRNALVVDVDRAARERALGILGALPQVAAVEDMVGTPAHARLRVVPREGRLIVEEAGAALAGAGVAVAALAIEPGRLDDVFRALTLPAAA